MIAERRTAHLLLSRMEPDDFGDLLGMHRDPQVMAPLGGVRSDEWTLQFVEMTLEHWDRYGFGIWTAREPVSQEFIGRGGLRHVTIDGRDEVEVGYGLLRAYWGRGLATELAVESVRVAFTALQLPELVCFTLTTNYASQRVMQKAGFRYEREFIWAGEPHLLHRQTAAEWRTRVK